MQKLIITNNVLEESLTIDYNANPYMLQDLVGLSDAPIDLLVTEGFQQDGTTAAGEFFNARIVSFSVIVFGTSLEDVFSNRRALIRHLNPKHSFTCIYQNDYTIKRFECRVSRPPKFISTQQNKGFRSQLCVVSLRADNPFLLDEVDTTNELAVVTGAFEFPLSFEPTIEFATLVDKQITIHNDGDVETPITILFQGASENPSITNVTTGEFIKVITTLSATESLEITTGYGNKKVTLIDSLGNRTNAFNLIDEDSDFWSLVVGDNIVTYDADSGADSATVLITYANRFVGV